MSTVKFNKNKEELEKKNRYIILLNKKKKIENNIKKFFV